MGSRADKNIEQTQFQVEADEAGFLKAIGERVRNARSRRNITRKTLAERSGVSERYLALLESGQGNVSVLVLREVGAALGLPAEALLRDADDEPAQVAFVMQLIRDMTPRTLTRARELLLQALRDDPKERSRRIALIGLRGAGKTTLGEKLAQSLKRPFIELDREIEREAGTGLSEIFLLYGQQGYRRYERRCLEQLLGSGQSCVIATGGSIVTEQSTCDLLLSTCYTVWLKATPEEHMQRVIAQGDTRPMAGHAQAMADLRRILESRIDLYGQADITVDTAGKSVRQALAALKQAVTRT
ncbi:MAG: helix-turn-helix transcriptional regulator [Burkholderiales bacterium]|jgi:XRE family aerobic/anaerobic benzoate catabolism transcriptional regulator